MRAERIDLYPAQLRRGRVPLRCQAGGTQGYDRGSGSGVESGWTQNRKQRFSEGGHSAGCFAPFRLRNISVAPAQLRIFIRNRWLKSIVCAAIEVIWLLYLLLLLFFFFFFLFVSELD